MASSPTISAGLARIYRSIGFPIPASTKIAKRQNHTASRQQFYKFLKEQPRELKKTLSFSSQKQHFGSDSEEKSLQRNHSDVRDVMSSLSSSRNDNEEIKIENSITLPQSPFLINLNNRECIPLDSRGHPRWRIDETRQIGSGQSGIVWQACLPSAFLKRDDKSSYREEDCSYVVKIQPVYENMDKQLHIAVRMGLLDIGPRVLDAWVCDDLDVVLPHVFKELKKGRWETVTSPRFLIMVMESLGEHARSVPCSYPSMKAALQFIEPYVLPVIRRMHDAGVMHNDLWCKNIIASYASKDDVVPKRVTIIDWDTATETEDGGPLSSTKRIGDVQRLRFALPYHLPMLPASLFSIST